jgi:hypothetical protein
LLSPPGGLGTTAWARRKAVAGLAAAECAPRPSGRFAPPVETRLRALAKSVAREEQARRARPGRGARKPARGGAQGGAAARVAEAVAALGMSAVVQREGARGAAGGAHEGSEGGGGDLYLAYLPSGLGSRGADGPPALASPLHPFRREPTPPGGPRGPCVPGSPPPAEPPRPS